MKVQTKLKQQGFTIVELLIVIVIIGILATIGFVSFSSAQNKAKKSKATATLAQVKSKLGEYFADNNSYPGAKGSTTDTGTTSPQTIIGYLNGNGGGSTATEFSNSAYTYTPSPSGCTTAANDCSSYTLTAAKSYWNGASSEADLTVTP